MATSETQIVRRLTAAEGYLELQLPEMALDELNGIVDPGRFILPCLWLTGESLKSLGRFDEAVTTFEQLTSRIPAPMCPPPVVASLYECLKRLGRPLPGEQSSDPASGADEKSGPGVSASGPADEATPSETPAPMETPAPTDAAAPPVLNFHIPQLGTIAIQIGDVIELSIKLERPRRIEPE